MEYAEYGAWIKLRISDKPLTLWMNGEGSGVAVGSQAKADVNENIEFLHPLFTAADPLAFSLTAPTDKDYKLLLFVQLYYPYY